MFNEVTMEFPFNKDITYFARTNFRGTDQIFGIKRKDRRQHMYVLGKSGTGKSVMLENMIIQNIHQGEGVCVVDPHGELVEKILETIPPERVKDVIYFNPSDTDHNIGFNVLQLDDPRYKHLVASGLMGIFTKIWANAWSSRMEYILNNTILALLDSPDTTLLGIPRMLVDKDYRQYIINNLKDPVVKAFWVHEYEAWRDQFRNEAIAPIQNKVGQFLSSNIVRNVVGQTRSTINIYDIMNQKKIFLVNVSKGRIGEDNSALLGGMLITKLQLSAMERVRIPENQREDFYLYVDEFQNFVTDSFASILSEARKYRLNLIIAHQYIKQLETPTSKAVRDAVFGNVGTMIVFRVGADDADALEKEFEPEFTVEDFVNLPNYHIYTKLMVDGVTSRPFSAKTLPPAEIAINDETRDLVIETSRKLYTRSREEVEAEIQRWSSTVPGQSRPDGEEMEGKFKAECSNCKKVIYVPFEPEPGRPIYCKDCLFKIKNGELSPGQGFRPPREKRDTTSYDALSSLGIEFAATLGQKEMPKRTPNAIRPPDQGRPAPQHQSVFDKVASVIKPKASAPIIRTEPQREVPQAQVIATPKPEVESNRSSIQTPQRTIPNRVAVPMQPQSRSQPQRVSQSAPPRQVISQPVRTSFVRKEREHKPRETEGLQSILKQALAEVHPQKIIEKQDTEKITQTEPRTISLNELQKAPITENANPQITTFVIKPKEASVEKQELLRNAIAKAVQPRPPVVVEEITPVAQEKSLENTQSSNEYVNQPHIPEEKEDLATEEPIKEKLVDVPLQVQTDMTLPEVPIESIPVSAPIPTPKVEERNNGSEPEINSSNDSLTDNTDASSKRQKRVREIPEDILKQMLE